MEQRFAGRKKGVYRFGFWHDTNKFPITDGGLNRGLSSIYIAVDQQLYAKNGSESDGLYLFALAGWVFQHQQHIEPVYYDIHAGA